MFYFSTIEPAYRYAAGTISYPLVKGFWRVVSEGFRVKRIFPADCLHRTDCHFQKGSTVGYSGIPAYSQIFFS